MSNKEYIKGIQESVKEYLSKNKMKSVIIGISGGFDSAFNVALIKPICDELQIPIIGRYIHIESNKNEEKERACNIGKHFCHNFKSVDLTDLYYTSLKEIEEGKMSSFDKIIERMEGENVV